MTDQFLRRRWCRFSLASALLTLCVGCVLLAWWRDHTQLRERSERNAQLVEMLLQEPTERFATIAPPGVPVYETAEQYIADLKTSRHWTIQNSLGVRRTPVGRKAVPKLIELLSGERQETRVRAARALGNLATPVDVIVPALLRVYGDPDPRFHYSTVAALKDIGPEAKDAIPVLLQSLQNSAESNPATVAMAVWTIGRDLRAIDALIRLLDHNDSNQRIAAADYLHSIGPMHTQDATAALMRARRDKHPTVRCVALNALVKLVSREDALHFLAEAGRDDDARVRSTATSLLKALNK